MMYSKWSMGALCSAGKTCAYDSCHTIYMKIADFRQLLWNCWPGFQGQGEMKLGNLPHDSHKLFHLFFCTKHI